MTGYGAIELGPRDAHLIEAGIIAPDPGDPLERRLGALYDELLAVVRATRPDVMVVEEVWTAYRNPTTAVLMGHARGVLCLAAHVAGVRVRHSCIPTSSASWSGRGRRAKTKSSAW